MNKFDFGTNWQAFSEKRVNPERVKAVVMSLLTLLLCQSWSGLMCLNVGRDSKPFSIANSFCATSELLIRKCSVVP